MDHAIYSDSGGCLNGNDTDSCSVNEDVSMHELVSSMCSHLTSTMEGLNAIEGNEDQQYVNVVNTTDGINGYGSMFRGGEVWRFKICLLCNFVCPYYTCFKL